MCAVPIHVTHLPCLHCTPAPAWEPNCIAECLLVLVSRDGNYVSVCIHIYVVNLTEYFGGMKGRRRLLLEILRTVYCYLKGIWKRGHCLGFETGRLEKEEDCTHGETRQKDLGLATAAGQEAAPLPV